MAFEVESMGAYIVYYPKLLLLRRSSFPVRRLCSLTTTTAFACSSLPYTGFSYYYRVRPDLFPQKKKRTFPLSLLSICLKKRQGQSYSTVWVPCPVSRLLAWPFYWPKDTWSTNTRSRLESWVQLLLKKLSTILTLAGMG